MKYLKRRSGFVILITIFILFVYSCKREPSVYHDQTLQQTTIFNGSVIDYLKSQNGVYDSMVAVLERYPDIIDSLNSGKPMTLFAIPNADFVTAEVNANIARAALDSPSLYFRLAEPNVARIDSGMFNYDLLKELISRYIFNGHYSFDTLKTASAGYTMPSLSGYKMNLRASSENAVGSVGSGPKVIELSDVNRSDFERFWKTTFTTSSSTALANNVLVHKLTTVHEFGFASFSDMMLQPKILKTGWKAIAYHSYMLGYFPQLAFDDQASTFWHTQYPNQPPPPYYIVVDMGKSYPVSGFTILGRQDDNYYAAPTKWTLEFADKDTSTWFNKATYEYPPPVNQARIQTPYTFKLATRVASARYFKFTGLATLAYLPSSPFIHITELWMNY